MSIAGFDMKAYEGDLDEDMAEAGNSCSVSLSVALDLRQDDARKIVFLWEVLLFCKDNVTAVTPARADLKTNSANGRTTNSARRVAISPFPRAFALLSEIVVPFLNLLLSMHQTCPLFSRCLLDECACHPRVDLVEVGDSPALFHYPLALLVALIAFFWGSVLKKWRGYEQWVALCFKRPS